MQHPPQMIPMMSSFPPNNITTEQIQKNLICRYKQESGAILNGEMHLAHLVTMLDDGGRINVLITSYLDENKKLILAILDNQNLGKLAECAQYQAQLQKNLMYLAAIADAQPQVTPTMPPQMAPHPAIQPGGYFMQHPQAAAIAQQEGMFPQKLPFQFNNLHQMQDAQQQQLQLQHQQTMQAQMGIRPGGPNNGIHPIQAEANLEGSSGGPSSASGPNDGRGGNKQEVAEAGAAGQGSTAGGHGPPP